MTVKIDGVPINKLMEVSINKILTANNEVKYIIQSAQRRKNISPELTAAIQEEFNDLKQTAARLLSYLVLLDNQKD